MGGAGGSVYSAVYPRVCGGTPKVEALTGRYEGLSPRVRGNPIRVKKKSLSDRSIPACAGEPGRI